MRHFWNWVRNDDESRTLYLDGVIAEESWFSDDITPAMFKEELLAGNGPITIHLNSPGGDCIAASQIYTMGTELRTAQNELAKLQKQHEVLKQEVVKALCGESSYPSDLLSGLIAEKEEAIRVATERVEKCKQSQSNESEKIRFLGNQYQNIKSWAAEFDRATTEQQKMILAKLIEKITVDRDYNIHIYFFVTQDEFRQSVSLERTTVSEAERCEFAV